jgi:hypothetical protein
MYQDQVWFRLRTAAGFRTTVSHWICSLVLGSTAFHIRGGRIGDMAWVIWFTRCIWHLGLIHTYHAVPMPRPCHSPAISCRYGFRLCISHLIYTCHAAPVPCHDHAVLKATYQGHGTARLGRGMGMAWHVWISIGRPQTACGRPARFRLLPATTRSSTKVAIRSIPIR